MQFSRYGKRKVTCLKRFRLRVVLNQKAGPEIRLRNFRCEVWFQESVEKWKMGFLTSKLWEARYQLCQRRSLQVNTRWKALDEIFKIHKPLHRSELQNLLNLAELFSTLVSECFTVYIHIFFILLSRFSFVFVNRRPQLRYIRLINGETIIPRFHWMIVIF